MDQINSHSNCTPTHSQWPRILVPRPSRILARECLKEVGIHAFNGEILKQMDFFRSLWPFVEAI